MIRKKTKGVPLTLRLPPSLHADCTARVKAKGIELSKFLIHGAQLALRAESDAELRAKELSEREAARQLIIDLRHQGAHFREMRETNTKLITVLANVLETFTARMDKAEAANADRMQYLFELLSVRRSGEGRSQPGVEPQRPSRVVGEKSA